MSSSNRPNLNHSFRSFTANPGQAPNLETLVSRETQQNGAIQEATTSATYAEHVHPEEYYDKDTGIRLVARPVLYPPNNSHPALDRELEIRRPPDLSIISGSSSWTSQRGAGSRPSTAGSGISQVTWRPLPSPVQSSFYGRSTHSRDNSTWSGRDAPSSTSPIKSWSSVPRQQRFGRSEQYLAPDSYQGSTHRWSQDRQSAPTFDRASRTSTSSSSLKSKVSGLWSMLSMTTSMTSLSSRRSRAKAPKLDLEIPTHELSLGLGTLLGNSQSPRNANSARSQGTLQQASETETPRRQTSVYITVPQHLLAGPSRQGTSTSFNRNQEILPLVPEASPQTPQASPIPNDPLPLSPIEQAIQSHHQTFHVVKGTVISGTLEGLVEFLISAFDLPGHTHYRDTFLIACSELTTPEDVFQILSRRLSEEQHTSDDGAGRQYTIFVFIIYWLKSNCFSPNQELLYRIKFFCEESSQLYPPLDSIAKETWQLIDTKVAQRPIVRALNPQEPVLKSSQIKPRDLAVALGLLEGDNYKVLEPSDYLLYLSKGQSDRVKVYHRTNEKIRLWVIRSVLHYDTVSGRSEVMKFYINTALECYSMRNFSSTVAISTALHSVLVENLKATRKALSTKMQTHLSTLCEIIDPQSNHRGYYDAIHAATTVQERDTCIPWLAVHVKELDKVARQPLTVLVEDQHLVSFARYNRFMDRIKEILHYSPPDLEDKRHGGQLTYLLKQLRGIDLSVELEQQLLTESKALSLRESSNGPTEENLRRVGL